ELARLDAASPSCNHTWSQKASISAALGTESVALMRQQPALDRNRIAFGDAHEAAKRAVRADDAMAGNHQRDRICAARAADRARRGVQRSRQLAVSARLPDRNLRQRIPDPAPKERSRRREGQAEAELRIGEIALDLPTGTLGDGVGRRLRALGA